MAEATNFWTAAPKQDPKRNFRFRVQITGLQQGYLWYAKKADRPMPSVSKASHSYLNHTYHWPARVTWNDVTITFVDPVDPDVNASMADLLEASGYRVPANPGDNSEWASISKQGATEALGEVIVESIDEDGNSLETWSLNNAFIMEINFGTADYSSDDLMEVSMKFSYDWASFIPRSGGTRALNGLGSAELFKPGG